MEQKKVYIIHGYNAGPEKHWFPWLQKRLAEQSVAADILKMPSPAQPRLGEWVAHIAQNVNTLDGNTFFVGHSLGCISLLHFLQQNAGGKAVGGLLLVSGFAKPLHGLTLLDEFSEPPLNEDLLIKTATRRAVVASKNDPIVPFSFTKELAGLLQADFFEVEHGGHFLGAEGFTTLPLVYDILIKMIKT
ncbi:MAG: alpha/beta hydrolase [Oscillospiraceae bacterium]|jgi:predicted alpha/beta hydrolase family esterase|nr:alpha/beta hydrolase [Oscillospiraceae bacterium]